jgi:hypothetical protein
MAATNFLKDQTGAQRVMSGTWSGSASLLDSWMILFFCIMAMKSVSLLSKSPESRLTWFSPSRLGAEKRAASPAHLAGPTQGCYCLPFARVIAWIARVHREPG